jgi:hypothetical protein
MPDGRLAYLDFGMMANVPADQRYALVGMTLGLQNKDIGLVAANLVKLGFLPDETQLDIVVPALEAALADVSFILLYCTYNSTYIYITVWCFRLMLIHKMHCVALLLFYVEHHQYCMSIVTTTYVVPAHILAHYSTALHHNCTHLQNLFVHITTDTISYCIYITTG